MDGDFDFHTGFDGDGSDLLDDFRGGNQIDQALVDTHFEAIPGLGTFTVGRLTGGDAEGLGRHADGSLDGQLLILGTADQIGTDLNMLIFFYKIGEYRNLFEGSDLARRKGDADTVGLDGYFNVLLGAHIYLNL